MDFGEAIKWGLYDRVLATLSLVVGLGIAAAGMWFGTADWLLSGDISSAPSGSGVAITLGGILLGMFVWQLGKTAARHRTMVSATERRVHRRLSGQEIEAPGGDLDERIAQLESDVDEVRRLAARIEQSVGDGGTAGATSAATDATGAESAGAAGTAGAGTSADGGTGAGADGAAAGAGASGGAGATDGAATGASGSTAGSGASAGAGDAEFADGQSGAAAGDAGQGATSTTDGGTTGGEAGQDDAFEWAEDDDEGEYYRNK